MGSVILKHISKAYQSRDQKNKKKQDLVYAVKDFNLEIDKNEFVVFVGPSGCGKSTTLRMIAGLEDITEGELYIDGKYVNDVSAKNRDIAMVFQNYALYPHMNAYDNIAFSLTIKKIPYEATYKGEKAYTYDVETITKRKKYLKKLNVALKDYIKLGDAEKEQRVRDIIASTMQALAEDEIKLAQDKAYFAEYKKVREEYFKLKKAGASAELESITLKKQELESKLVPLIKYRHYTHEEIDSRVHEVANILDIEPILKRKPREMSGGQRQRIALGRAIVRKPKVFLFDEPLSNVDAKLRASMRSEITSLYNRLATPFIYVTHDQVEAMTMGTKIVVMKDGVVQQIDTPENVFDYPSNIFVAGFIGTPQMNFFDCTIKATAKKLTVTLDNGYEFSDSLSNFPHLEETYLDGQEHKVTLGVRGEHIEIVDEGMLVEVGIVEALGTQSHVLFHTEGFEQQFVLITPYRFHNTNSKCNVKFNTKNLYFFDKQTTNSIIVRG